MAIVCMAMFTLTACNEDEGTPKGEKTSLFIQIGKSADNKSRATGADMSDADVIFTSGYLIFTTGDKIGRVVDIKASPSGADEVAVSTLESGTEITGVPASTTNVYLLGNLGTSHADIGTAIASGSLATVESETWTLANIQNSANTVADVPVYGEGVVSPGIANPDRLESTFDVGPVGARLQIETISCSDTEVTKLELKGIYINGFYHSMDVDAGFEASYMVNNGIDISKYPATGYATYTTMSDILTTAVDVKAASATPGTDLFWAYNFFPAQMPHIVLHFASLEATGGVSVTNKYATVAKYSTTGDGDPTKMVTTALPGSVYTLSIDISDYETQITDLPESNSEVVGHVTINIIDWTGATIYPEW